jgi:hypothetical protein
VPVGVTGHRPPNQAAQGPSCPPRTTPSPSQLPTGPRGRTVANIAASGPSDRAAGRRVPAARRPHPPLPTTQHPTPTPHPARPPRARR